MKYNYKEMIMVCELKLERELTENEIELLKTAYGVGFRHGEDYAVEKFEENGWG